MSVMIRCAGSCGDDVHLSLMFTPPYAVLWMVGHGDPAPERIRESAYCNRCFAGVHGKTLPAVPYLDVLATAGQAASEKQRVAAAHETYLRQRDHVQRMRAQQQERDRATAIRATVACGHVQHEVSRPASFLARKAAKAARDVEVRNRLRGLAGQSSSKKRQAA